MGLPTHMPKQIDYQGGEAIHCTKSFIRRLTAAKGLWMLHHYSSIAVLLLWADHLILWGRGGGYPFCSGSPLAETKKIQGQNIFLIFQGQNLLPFRASIDFLIFQGQNILLTFQGQNISYHSEPA